MNSIVVYSSRTGNTLKVAQAVYEALPSPRALYSVDEAPDPGAYDFIALGFWVDKGTADEKARRYLKKLKGKPIFFLFGTLGAYPDSDHGKKCMGNVKALAADNQILGTFLCQGRVDPEMIKWMEENLQDDPHHAMTPERRARLREAERHPNADDLAAAGQQGQGNTQQNAGKTAGKFALTPEKSPLFVVEIREMTGRCSAGSGEGLDFQWFDQGKQA